MASIAAIRKFGFTPRIETRETDGITFRGMKGQQRLGELLAKWDAEMARVYENNDLTPQAKLKRTRRAAEDVLGEIAKTKTLFLTPIRQARARLDTQLRTVPGLVASTDPAMIAREIEARGYLKTMGEGERLLAFQKAVEDGDELTFRACIHAPGLLRLFIDRVLEEGRQAWIEKVSPQLARDHKEAVEIETILSENFDDLERGVRSDSNMPRTRVSSIPSAA